MPIGSNGHSRKRKWQTWVIAQPSALRHTGLVHFFQSRSGARPTCRRAQEPLLRSRRNRTSQAYHQNLTINYQPPTFETILSFERQSATSFLAILTPETVRRLVEQNSNTRHGGISFALQAEQSTEWHDCREIPVCRNNRRQRTKIDQRNESRHPIGSLHCRNLTVHLVYDCPGDFLLPLYFNEAKRLSGLDEQIDLTPLSPTA